MSGEVDISKQNKNWQNLEAIAKFRSSLESFLRVRMPALDFFQFSAIMKSLLEDDFE